MSTEPNAALLADAAVPRVTLGGREWPVPRLAIKQNRVVVPLLVRHFRGVTGTKAAGIMDTLTTEAIDDLSTVAFLALQRGHASLTRDEFDDMPINPLDLLMAAVTIAEQTGAMTRPKSEASPPQGEAKAQTGTT